VERKHYDKNKEVVWQEDKSLNHKSTGTATLQTLVPFSQLQMLNVFPDKSLFKKKKKKPDS